MRIYYIHLGRECFFFLMLTFLLMCGLRLGPPRIMHTCVCATMQACIDKNMLAYAHDITSIHTHMHTSVRAAMLAKSDMGSTVHVYMHQCSRAWIHACIFTWVCGDAYLCGDAFWLISAHAYVVPCMSVYIHVCMRPCACMCTHANMHIYVMHMFIRAFIQSCKHASQLCIHTHMHSCKHARTHAHIHKHTCVDACIFTRNRACVNA